MNNLSVSTEHSIPFSNPHVENSHSVVSNVPVSFVAQYSNCLAHCPRIKTYLVKALVIVIPQSLNIRYSKAVLLCLWHMTIIRLNYLDLK